MDWAIKTPVTNKNTSRPTPTKEKEKERLCSDVSASDSEDHRVNLLEGPVVSLQTLEGT